MNCTSPVLPGKHTVRRPAGRRGPWPGCRPALCGLCALQGGQAGVQRVQCTAALGGEPGAEAVGAELRPGIAAHGADDGIGPQGLGGPPPRLELHGVAAAALAQGLHGAAGAHLDAQLRQMMLQQGQHVRRLIGVGVHPARPRRCGCKGPAHGTSAAGRRRSRRPAAAQRGAVGSEIQLRCDALLSRLQRPLPVASSFLPGFGLRSSTVTRAAVALCRRQRGCKTGGTAAQNEDVWHPDTCLSWNFRICLYERGARS